MPNVATRHGDVEPLGSVERGAPALDRAEERPEQPEDPGARAHDRDRRGDQEQDPGPPSKADSPSLERDRGRDDGRTDAPVDAVGDVRRKFGGEARGEPGLERIDEADRLAFSHDAPP